MKSSSCFPSRGRLLTASLAISLLTALQPASAATQYWDPGLTPTANSGTGSGGSGTWTTLGTNWSNGTLDTTLTATNIAGFSGASGGTVALTTAVTSAGVQFDVNGYTIGDGTNTGQLTLSAQTNDTSGIVVGAGVTGTVINLGSVKLGSLNSSTSILLTNTDLVNFGNTTVYLSGTRTTKVSNSTASGTTTLQNFAVSDKPAGGTWPVATVQLNQGNLTINNLAGAANANGTLSTFGGDTLGASFLTTFSGSTTGTLTINGNNTLYNNSGTSPLAQLTFVFNMANGTLALGHDNALGARNASNALTGTSLQMNAGTISASGGARTIENALIANGNFTIGGSNNMTFGGNVTNSGGNRTITVNNTASTTISGAVFLSESSVTARTLTIGGTGNTTISGAIKNFNGVGLSGALTKTGSGKLTLANATNDYSGGTTISGGTVALGVNNGLSANSALSLGNATLDMATFSASAPSLALTSSSAILKIDFTGRAIDNSTAFLALTGGLTESSNMSGYTLDFGGFTFSSAGSYKLLSFTSAGGTLVAGDFNATNLNLSGVAGSFFLSGSDLSFITTSAIPEPATYAGLVGMAGLVVAAIRRRRR